eukprot:c1173_g1_i2 orf=77-319(+)
MVEDASILGDDLCWNLARHSVDIPQKTEQEKKRASVDATCDQISLFMYSCLAFSRSVFHLKSQKDMCNSICYVVDCQNFH